MRAESYLTRLDGLLASVVYQPRVTGKRAAVSVACWRAPAKPVRGTCTTVTRVPGRSVRSRAAGVTASATPVCGFRLSLHG